MALGPAKGSLLRQGHTRPSKFFDIRILPYPFCETRAQRGIQRYRGRGRGTSLALAESNPFHIGTCARSIFRGEIHNPNWVAGRTRGQQTGRSPISEIRAENSLRLLRRGLGVQGSFSRAKNALFQDDNEGW